MEMILKTEFAAYQQLSNPSNLNLQMHHPSMGSYKVCSTSFAGECQLQVVYENDTTALLLYS
jgi:hypothetical protein